MKNLNQHQIDKLRETLAQIEGRTVSEQFEYFEHLIGEKPIKIDARVPNCSVDYLGIIGKGATLNIAAIAWIAHARATLAQIEGGARKAS